MALWQHSTGTVSELAQHLDLPAHAMTPLLQRLEQAGLIVRRRSPIDSRAVLMEVTSSVSNSKRPQPPCNAQSNAPRAFPPL